MLAAYAEFEVRPHRPPTFGSDPEVVQGIIAGGMPALTTAQEGAEDSPEDVGYEEADDGSSPRDRRAKTQIVLRELKETSFRLRILRKEGILTAEHDPVLGECAELVKIVATLLRKSRPV